MLELIGLRRSFDDVVALDGVSFAVPEGAIVGFVGPNGAGKTTAMRIALGVLEPDAGEVRWRGEPVDALARRRFGYMPEERGLYPKMRVLEQLVYLARLHGLPAGRCRPPRGRDRGHARRRGAARTTAWNRSPSGTSSGCSSPRRSCTSPTRSSSTSRSRASTPSGSTCWPACSGDRPQNHGVPVVFSSHQLDLVERICDAVVLIDHGRIVASGTIDELRASARAPVAARRGRRAPPTGGTTPLPGVTLEAEADGGVVLRLDDDVDEQRVLDLARASGDVLHFTRVRPSLAELFREVVSA